MEIVIAKYDSVLRALCAGSYFKFIFQLTQFGINTRPVNLGYHGVELISMFYRKHGLYKLIMQLKLMLVVFNHWLVLAYCCF
jgi:hypothetical protein